MCLLGLAIPFFFCSRGYQQKASSYSTMQLLWNIFKSPQTTLHDLSTEEFDCILKPILLTAAIAMSLLPPTRKRVWLDNHSVTAVFSFMVDAFLASVLQSTIHNMVLTSCFALLFVFFSFVLVLGVSWNYLKCIISLCLNMACCIKLKLLLKKIWLYNDNRACVLESWEDKWARRYILY